MDVQDMRIFARVAAVRNLSSVGIEMNLTPGTISKRIQALEDDLGARLFDRNTRSIHITEEGQKLLEYVSRILQEIEGARAAVGVNVEQPRGKLRISAPVSLGDVVAPAICAFMSLHAEIDVQIDLTDRVVNLQEDGYDVVIRKGKPNDSGLIRKPLAADKQIIVASPLYLKTRGTPERPADLQRHSCLLLGEGSHWEFLCNGEIEAVKVAGRLRSDNGEMLLYGARAGLGIIRASKARVNRMIADDYLRPILEDFEVSNDSSIYALYPGAKHVLPKLRVFLNFLGDWFREPRLAVAFDQVSAPGALQGQPSQPSFGAASPGAKARRSPRRVRA